MADEKIETRNYKYGANAPLLNHDMVEEQMFQAHLYHNALIEIERRWRRVRQGALLRVAPNIWHLEDQRNQFLRQIRMEESQQKALNVTQRGTKVAPDVKRRIGDLRSNLETVEGQIKAARTAAYGTTAWKQRLAIFKKWRKRATAKARKACGAFWGTYLTVERAAKASFKASVGAPKFRRWRDVRARGTTTIAVQIQGGASVEALLSGEHKYARIEVMREGAWISGTRRPRKVGTAILWLRVGSEGKRNEAPVWTRVPFHYHRPLPADTEIMWVYAMRTRVGDKDRWSVMFSCKGAIPQKPRAASGRVAIDVGWRWLDGGLVVGTWAASDGAEGEIRLGSPWLGEMLRTRGIASIRDTNRDNLLKWLVPALRDPSRRDSLPTYVQEVLPHLHLWKSKEKIGWLCKRWRDDADRPKDQDDIVQRFEEWRARDKHLWDFEANLRDQQQASRKDFYRMVAARFAERYGTVVMENLNYSSWHRNPPIERSGSPASDRIKRNVRHANLSSLRNALASRMNLKAVSPYGTTIRCHVCGRNTGKEWTDKGALTHTCAGCGATWNRDRNAARNILAASGPVPTWTLGSLESGEVWTCGGDGGTSTPAPSAARQALASDDATSVKIGA